MNFHNKLDKLKLIVFDLDGTLLNDKGVIGIETKKLIKKLKEFDVHFSFASGRLHSALTKYADELEIDTPLISLDGCLIKSYPEGNIIFESFVKENYVLKAIHYADRFLVSIALCHADAIFYTDENATIPQVMEKFGAKYQEVESYDDYIKNTLEIVFAGDNGRVVKFISERLSFPYSFGLNTSYFRSNTKEGIYYLEVRKKGSSKRKGLIRLLKYLKLNFDEAAVLGDWYNDLSLFKTRALKIALSNAVPEIKSLADFISEKSNNEDGAAEFLEMVLKSKEKTYGRRKKIFH